MDFEELNLLVSPELMSTIEKMADDQKIGKADLVRKSLGLYKLAMDNGGVVTIADELIKL